MTYKPITAKAMARRTGFTFTQYYWRLHQWLRRRCDRLTVKQRKTILYGLSLVYLVCALMVTLQAFLPQKENSVPVHTDVRMDGKIRIDTLYDAVTNDTP